MGPRGGCAHPGLWALGELLTVYMRWSLLMSAKALDCAHPVL